MEKSVRGKEDGEQNLATGKATWGEHRKDHFGYASNDERLEKRGMEDWELVERIPESQLKVPYWFWAVVAIVLLVGVGLSFPFWGLRPGVVVNWTDWVKDPGFIGSLVYVTVAGVFVWYMVNMYGSSATGRLDSDKDVQKEAEHKK
ncbi:MAG: hypothetical protein R8K48_07670 [Gallionella sp.]